MTQSTIPPPATLEWSRRLLEPLGRGPVLLVHNPGNNGDRLIDLGARVMLEDAGVRLTDSAEGAKWFVLTGGGGMNEYWGTQFARFMGICQRWSDRPLLVLPSTYRFKTGTFASLVRGRSAATVFAARDRVSYDYLRSLDAPSCVSVRYAHDGAFALAAAPWVTRLASLRPARPAYVLLVERSDGEHHASTATLERTIHPILPEAGAKAKVKRLLRPLRQWQRRRRHLARLEGAGQFTEPSDSFSAESTAWAASVGLQDLPFRCGDASDNYRFSFSEFEDLVLNAAGVVTTRLHVGILSALFGIPTALRDGRYGKLAGVYEASMRHMPHVKLLTEEAR